MGLRFSVIILLLQVEGCILFFFTAQSRESFSTTGEHDFFFFLLRIREQQTNIELEAGLLIEALHKEK